MAQYATQDGGARSQYMPFGYDAGWLAQQQNHLQFGSSETFMFNQQQRPPQARASDSGILDQNDNSLLGDFFSNPDIANQMTFSYNTPIERGGGGGDEDNKASFPGGLLDMDFPSGTINDPAMAFATQHAGRGGEFHMQPHASSSMQQHGMGSQMGATQTQHEADDTNGDEEQTQAKAAQGLVGMSVNRPNPSQLVFGNINTDGSNFDLDNFMNSPSMLMRSPIVGAQETGGTGNYGQTNERQQPQASTGAFGYIPDAMSQYQHQQGYPQGVRLQQQAFSQPRGRPHSMGDIRTAALNNLPHTDPRSAQLSSINLNYFNNLRGPPRFPSYGSDGSFGPDGFRPQSGGFDSPDHKAANLNQVPMAQEASANGRARQPLAVPPSMRTLQSQSHVRGAGSQDFNSRPSTPTFYNTSTNYQSYVAGLPNTSGGTMTSAGSYGGFGAQHQRGHGHPQQPQYLQTLQRNGAGSGKHQVPEIDDQDAENSSVSEFDVSESPPPNPQPSSKRRKSKQAQDDEEDYHPDTTGSRLANSVIRSLARASEEEDYKPPNLGTGKKRPRSHTVQRKSTQSFSSNPSSPATLVPRLSSTTPKRPARKRQSGTALPRVNLTDEQRRDNHIKSEKNRRDLIKNNYEEIRNLVPALKGGKSGLSKAEELNEIVEFIENLLAGNLYVLDLLDNWDPDGSEQDGKFEYESSDNEGAGAAGALNMGLHAF